ncbi:LysR family transcriptional regulator [Stenotrophomonas maltophilia]|uniref:LysR family transcriptional regulator n=1 Tax=Stenotrophomonas maltophilia TaxID=40324 RepID=UPI0039F68F45
MLKHWPPLTALRGFEAAARLGSFHRAAEELHLSQSAISQQIRGLEDYLEQPLFFRQGRSVSLTDAGIDLLATTQAMLRQLAGGIRRLDQYRKPHQLIVSASPAFARHWLVPRLGDFRRRHPEADLWLLTSETPPDMASQTVDIAVGDDLQPQAQCQQRVLLQDRLYPACHPSVLAQPVAERTTLHGEREMDWSQWQVQGGADVGQQRAGLNFSEPGQLLDAACQGLGIALVSELLAAGARAQGLLQPLDEHRVQGPRWSWLLHDDSARDPLVVSFCNWLLATLERDDG